MGTWTLSDKDYSKYAIPEDLEYCFNADGTGYKIADGEKRNLTWWPTGGTSDGYITYQLEGAESTSRITYNTSVYSFVEYGKLYFDVGDMYYVELDKAPDAGPAAPTPEETITFTDTVADLTGVWTLDHFISEQQEVAGDPLEVHLQANGQGFVVKNGTEFPATWYRAGEEDGVISVNCMFSVDSPEGTIQYVYNLRYITDSQNEHYHQMLYDANEYYIGVMNKISNYPAGMGSENAEAALGAALGHIGITEEQADEWILSFDPSAKQYEIAVNYGDTRYIFQISGKNAGILDVQTYPAGGVTLVEARDIILAYLGIDLNDVCYLNLFYYNTGVDRSDDPVIEAQVRSPYIGATVRLDYYGRILSITERSGEEMDEGREDVIGWRAARDLYLELKGLRMEDLTKFECLFSSEHVTSAESRPAYYSVDQFDYENTVIIHAQNGTTYDDNTFRGDYSTAAILTLTEITEIALNDLGADIRALYEAGNGEITHTVHYTGGAKENDPKFEYEWTLVIGENTYSYRIDAFTGQILSR